MSRGLNLLRDVPIQRKLTIISMLTSGLALLVAGLAFFAYEQMTFLGAMFDRLAITASMVADSSAAALLFDDPASAAQTLATLSADKHIGGGDTREISRHQRGRSWRFISSCVAEVICLCSSRRSSGCWSRASS